MSTIVDGVLSELSSRGYDAEHPWYFPTMGEYITKLEAHGFEARYATLFDRPTELDEGADGFAAWLDTFGDSLLSSLSNHEAKRLSSASRRRYTPRRVRRLQTRSENQSYQYSTRMSFNSSPR